MKEEKLPKKKKKKQTKRMEAVVQFSDDLLSESPSSLSEEEDRVTKKVRNIYGTIVVKNAANLTDHSFKQALNNESNEAYMDEDDSGSEPDLNERVDYHLDLSSDIYQASYSTIKSQNNLRMLLFVRWWCIYSGEVLVTMLF
ncbi:hypothetical protein Sjap_025881 [Stephania japonica]|uniref:Uncharacterized protein n=1 Tax=Stephania japonica TaxID=461633 RepID=A0AAP0HJY4_9MAGN